MYYYVRLRISPPVPEALTIRKTISDALFQTFGLSAEGTYVDVLSVTKSGEECVLRVRSEDASNVITSVVSWEEKGRFVLVRQSPFLPSLLAGSPT